MIEILVDATIVYIDGVKERFDAVQLTPEKAIIGRIFREGDKEEFVESGFISRRNIKKIYNGNKRKIQKMKQSS